MIIDLDAERGRISLSTKQLEPEPGDMVKNPEVVYEKAEEMAAKYREQMQINQQGAAPAAVADAIEEEIEIPSAEEEAVAPEEVEAVTPEEVEAVTPEEVEAVTPEEETAAPEEEEAVASAALVPAINE